MGRKYKKNSFLLLLFYMFVIDTIFLYGVVYLSSFIELSWFVDAILLILVFSLVVMFTARLRSKFSQKCTIILLSNNVLIMIVSFVMFGAFSNSFAELRVQKKSLGGALELMPSSNIKDINFDNTPYITIKNANFSKDKIYLYSSTKTLAKDPSTGQFSKVDIYCAKLSSHKFVELCVSCTIAPIDYTSKKICKEKIAYLDSLKDKSTINTYILTKSDILRLKPVKKDFNSYYENKKKLFSNITPWGYLVIFVSILIGIFI
jgi:hypothetical protein